MCSPDPFQTSELPTEATFLRDYKHIQKV